MQIIRGKQESAKKVILYGPEGIGKSSFAAQFPEPLFIDTEGSTKELDIARFEKPKTWETLLDEVLYVIEHPDCCKTLVIDTADWAERLEIEYLCRVNKWASIESPGYGKGYQYCADEFNNLLSVLDRVIEEGIHVVVTAHAKMRKFEQPDESGSYDRWEMKLSRQVAPLLKEWCDLLLFCNYKTYVIQPDSVMEKAKVQGGKRVMYTNHHPCWDAKNRYGLPDEMELGFEGIAHIFQEPAPKTKPIEDLRALMAIDGITDEQLQKVVSDKGHYPQDTPIDKYSDKFISGWIITHWARIVKLIRAEQSKTEAKEEA
ncbi:MAG: ATP-binding protein [Oscillospiraceae bacterium]|nr:ATP-binding protein [Oscillospiraceae bacterium]